MSEEQEKKKKEYPKFSPLTTEDEALWERYAQRIKELKAKKEKHEYPLDKNSPEFSRHSGFHRAMITHITPKEFLELAAPKAHIRESSLDYLLDAFENGDHKLGPLMLYIRADEKGCRVTGHQGRHRAEIAYDLDVEIIPVILNFDPDYTLDVDPPEGEGYDLVEEFGGRWMAYLVTKGGYEHLKEDAKPYAEGQPFKNSAYEDAIELMGDKWQEPEGCVISNLEPEEPYLHFTTIEEIKEKWKEYRKKYGLKDGKKKEREEDE